MGFNRIWCNITNQLDMIVGCMWTPIDMTILRAKMMINQWTWGDTLSPTDIDPTKGYFPPEEGVVWSISTWPFACAVSIHILFFVLRPMKKLPSLHFKLCIWRSKPCVPTCVPMNLNSLKLRNIWIQYNSTTLITWVYVHGSSWLYL